MTTRAKHPPLVEVQWDDSTTPDDTWLHPARLQEKLTRAHAVVCYSTGYLISRDKRLVTIAMSYALDKDGEIELLGGAMAIPVGCVTKIKRVRAAA